MKLDKFVDISNDRNLSRDIEDTNLSLEANIGVTKNLIIFTTESSNFNFLKGFVTVFLKDSGRVEPANVKAKVEFR